MESSGNKSFWRYGYASRLVMRAAVGGGVCVQQCKLKSVPCRFTVKSFTDDCDHRSRGRVLEPLGKACLDLSLGNQTILWKPHKFASVDPVTIAGNLPLAICLMNTFVSQSKGLKMGIWVVLKAEHFAFGRQWFFQIIPEAYGQDTVVS